MIHSRFCEVTSKFELGLVLSGVLVVSIRVRFFGGADAQEN